MEEEKEQVKQHEPPLTDKEVHDWETALWLLFAANTVSDVTSSDAVPLIRGSRHPDARWLCSLLDAEKEEHGESIRNPLGLFQTNVTFKHYAESRWNEPFVVFLRSCRMCMSYGHDYEDHGASHGLILHAARLDYAPAQACASDICVSDDLPEHDMDYYVDYPGHGREPYGDTGGPAKDRDLGNTPVFRSYTEWSSARVRYWAEKAVEQGNAHGMFRMYVYHASRTGTREPNMPLAVQYLHASAKAGHPPALLKLAELSPVPSLECMKLLERVPISYGKIHPILGKVLGTARVFFVETLDQRYGQILYLGGRILHPHLLPHYRLSFGIDETVPWVERGKHAALTAHGGRFIFQHSNGDADAEKGRIAVSFYNSYNTLARDACIMWILMCKRSGFNKDVRGIIARKIWATRSDACGDPLPWIAAQWKFYAEKVHQEKQDHVQLKEAKRKHAVAEKRNREMEEINERRRQAKREAREEKEEEEKRRHAEAEAFIARAREFKPNAEKKRARDEAAIEIGNRIRMVKKAVEDRRLQEEEEEDDDEEEFVNIF